VIFAEIKKLKTGIGMLYKIGLKDSEMI